MLYDSGEYHEFTFRCRLSPKCEGCRFKFLCFSTPDTLEIVHDSLVKRIRAKCGNPWHGDFNQVLARKMFFNRRKMGYENK